MTAARPPPLDLWCVDLAACETALRQASLALGFVAAGAGAAPPAAHSIDRPKELARLALSCLLCGYVGIEAARLPLLRGREGKPYLDAVAQPPASPLIEFSLAHAGEAALIAISQAGPVGVDIEAPRPVRLVAHRRLLLESAATALVPETPLAASPPDIRFLQAWVRLEAVAKATGEGVGSLLARMRESGDGTALLAPAAGAASVLQVRDVLLPGAAGYHAAVAASPDAIAGLGAAPAAVAVPADPDWFVRWAKRQIPHTPAPTTS